MKAPTPSWRWGAITEINKHVQFLVGHYRLYTWQQFSPLLRVIRLDVATDILGFNVPSFNELTKSECIEVRQQVEMLAGLNQRCPVCGKNWNTYPEHCDTPLGLNATLHALEWLPQPTSRALHRYALATHATKRTIERMIRTFLEGEQPAIPDTVLERWQEKDMQGEIRQMPHLMRPTDKDTLDFWGLS